MKCYTNKQITAIIDDYIHNSRDRAILKCRYIDGLTYEKIAEVFELTPRHIQRIVYKHENTIFKHLDD